MGNTQHILRFFDLYVFLFEVGNDSKPRRQDIHYTDQKRFREKRSM